MTPNLSCPSEVPFFAFRSPKPRPGRNVISGQTGKIRRDGPIPLYHPSLDFQLRFLSERPDDRSSFHAPHLRSSGAYLCC